MAEIRDVTETFAVAPQLRPEEVAPLAGRFRMLINNRPDGEAPDQPSDAEMRASAEAAGLAYVFAPVVGAPAPEQVRAVRDAVAAADGPVLAFCKSGTRSIVTWAVGEALAGRSIHELAEAGARAGYDVATPLSVLLPRYT